MDSGFQFNDESLKRHRISRQEALQVLESEDSEYFPLSCRNDNDRLMFVGFACGGSILLEVGVEFLPQAEERIFHANKARKYFVQLYNLRKRQ